VTLKVAERLTFARFAAKIPMRRRIAGAIVQQGTSGFRILALSDGQGL
jgi:hypothetical protein